MVNECEMYKMQTMKKVSDVSGFNTVWLIDVNI